MNIKRLVALSFICLQLGCVHLASVSLTPIPKERKRVVKAETSRFIFLGFNFDNDYVDSLADRLRRQCSGGKITGILTKDYVTNYFLFIFSRRTVEARGYCVKG